MASILVVSVGIGVGLSVCALAGLMLRLACISFNYGGTNVEATAAIVEADSSAAVEYETTEAGPYTSPSTFSTSFRPTLNTTQENFVPLPSITTGAQIFFLTLFGSLIVGSFIYGMLSNLVQPLILGSGSEVFFLPSFLMAAAFIHTILVTRWLNITWKKGLVLTMFCGLLDSLGVVAVFFILTYLFFDRAHN